MTEKNFATAYEAWRALAFPDGSRTSDEVDELHADLVLYDTWVADTVIPYVRRGVSEAAVVDVVGELRTFMTEVARAGTGAGEADQQLLAEYRQYAEALVQVYEGFLALPRPDPCRGPRGRASAE